MSDELKALRRQIVEAIVTSIRVVTPEPNWEATALAKAATAAKRRGNWDEAIDCLKKLRDVHGEHTTRLPLYLCGSGRWDEGIREFEALLESAGERARLDMSDVQEKPARKADLMRQYELAKIYDKMRVACKRAKRPAEAAKFKALASKHQLEIERLQPLVEQDDKERRDAILSRLR